MSKESDLRVLREQMADAASRSAPAARPAAKPRSPIAPVAKAVTKPPVEDRAPRASPEALACPVCERRRLAKAATMRRLRAKRADRA